MRGWRSIAIALLLLLLLGCQGGEQSPEVYPSKLVKIIVPYVPGGASDTIARLLAEELRESLGQPVIVENRSGGFGILAIEKMARSRPDGHTLFLGNLTTSALTPILYPDRFTIDYANEVIPVARVAAVPNALIATAKNFEPTSLEEVIQYAKQNPQKVRFGSGGVGSFSHLDMLQLANVAGIEMVHIPSTGGAGQALNDLGNGDIQFTFMNVATAVGMVDAGKIRPLAVTSRKRLGGYPGVATMKELGYEGIGSDQWFALFAPAETPSVVVEKIHDAVADALQQESLLQAFEKSMYIADASSSPEDARRWLDEEIEKWTQIVSSVDLSQ